MSYNSGKKFILYGIKDKLWSNAPKPLQEIMRNYNLHTVVFLTGEKQLYARMLNGTAVKRNTLKSGLEAKEPETQDPEP